MEVETGVGPISNSVHSTYSISSILLLRNDEDTIPYDLE